MFSIRRTYFMDIIISNHVHEKYNRSQTEINRKKNHPVYEDKTINKRKVVLVRETLIGNFKIRTVLAKF